MPPLFEQPWLAAASALSLAAVLAIGLWSASRTHSAKDFFVAGRRIGLWVVAMATMTAAFSGFVFLGGPGLTYRIGVASLFIIVPVGFTSGLLCWVLAKRLRLLAEIDEVFTIPDALNSRFDNRLTTALGSLAILIGTIGYLGAQLLALGILLESLLDTPVLFGAWSLPVALAIGLTILLFYSVMGGMVAGVYTDLVQGAVMLIGSLLVFDQAMRIGGGIHGITSSILSSGAMTGFFEPFGRVSFSAAVGFFFVFGVGVLGQPQMVHKFLMLERVDQLRLMPLVLGASQVVCLLIWVGIGLVVPALVAEGRMAPLDNADGATLRFLLDFVPDAMAGLLVAAALAAIMSTADSFLNIGAAVLVRDLPRLFGRPIRRELAAGRAATVLLALFAASLALGYGDLIALLGTFAFGTLAASLAPVLAVGFSWPRVGPMAASASIATGLVVNLGLEIWTRAQAVSGNGSVALSGVAVPSAVALAASFSVLMLSSWAVGERADVIPRAIRDIVEGSTQAAVDASDRVQ
jgi:Na+/proline symporter